MGNSHRSVLHHHPVPLPGYIGIQMRLFLCFQDAVVKTPQKGKKNSYNSLVMVSYLLPPVPPSPLESVGPLSRGLIRDPRLKKTVLNEDRDDL